MNKLTSLILAGATLVASAADFDSRVKVQYDGNFDDSSKVTTSVAAGPSGIYDKPVPSSAQFSEMFRAFDTLTFSDTGKDTHTLSAGVRPTFSIGNIEDKLLVYGSAFDQQGIGLENKAKIGNVTPNVSLELTQDASRAGAGISVNLSDNVNLEVGYDNVSFNSGEEINQVAGRLMIDKHPYYLGLAGLVRTGADEQSRVGGYFLKFNKGDGFGFRLINDSTFKPDSFNNFGQLIIAENAVSSKFGALTFFDRKASEDGSYNISIIPRSVSAFVPIRLPDRTASGYAATAEWNVNTSNGKSVGYTKAGAAYHIVSPNLDLGFSACGKYSFGSNNEFSVEPTLMLRKGKFEVDLGASVPISERSPTACLALQYIF